MNSQIEQVKREADIIAEQNQNATLHQLLVQIHKGAISILATIVHIKYTILFPKEVDDTFGEYYDEEAQRTFQQSLPPDEQKRSHFHDKQSQLHTQHLYKEEEQQIQLRRDTARTEQDKQPVTMYNTQI